MLLDLFLIGLVVTVEPLPLTGMILLLASERRPLIKGLGFLLGWLLTLVAIVALTVLVTGGKPLVPESSPSTAALAVKLLAGVVLVWIGYRRRRRPARAEPRRDPSWMASIDRVGPFGAAGLAFLLQPWVLVAAGVSTIVEAKLSNSLEWFALLAFCLWCTASYFVMETYAALRPNEVRDRLTALLQWINTHRDQAIVFLSMGLGLYLVAKSIYGLVSA